MIHIRITVLVLAAFISALSARAQSPAEDLAKNIRIGRVHFRRASMQEVISYLRTQAGGHLIGTERLEISTEVLSGVPRVAFSFDGRSLHDTLQEISRQTGLPLLVKGNRLYFKMLAEEVAVDPSQRSAEEENIQEALFRHMFDGMETNLEGATAFFIGMPNPSDAFLKRFATNKIPVRPVADAILGNEDNEYRTADRVTGKPGVHFFVGRSVWQSDSKVTIRGGTGFVGDEYELTHTTKKWLVTGRTDGPIY